MAKKIQAMRSIGTGTFYDFSTRLNVARRPGPHGVRRINTVLLLLMPSPVLRDAPTTPLVVSESCSPEQSQSVSAPLPRAFGLLQAQPPAVVLRVPDEPLVAKRHDD